MSRELKENQKKPRDHWSQRCSQMCWMWYVNKLSQHLKLFSFKDADKVLRCKLIHFIHIFTINLITYVNYLSTVNYWFYDVIFQIQQSIHIFIHSLLIKHIKLLFIICMQFIFIYIPKFLFLINSSWCFSSLLLKETAFSH